MQNPPYAKQRSSRRLRWSLPILLDQDRVIYSAKTEDLSAAGARLRVPVAFAPGCELAVTNLETGQRARFRVIWGQPEPGSDDCYSLGVEMLEPSDRFWGFDWSARAKPFGRGKPGESLSTQTLSWRERHER